MLGVKQPDDNASREAALYLPVKAFLERQGYEVKGEVRGCDLVARRGDEPPVIVEFKLRFNLALVLQGIDRLALTERVYLAVPRPRGGALVRDRSAIRKLCRRLGLGLILVGLSRGSVEILEEPLPYRPRPAKSRAIRLIDEFSRRLGDANVGGAAGVPLVTAYRQDALRCAQALAAHGPMRANALRAMAEVPTASLILRRNVYGTTAQRLWLVRQDRTGHLRPHPCRGSGVEPLCARIPGYRAMITDHTEERQRSLILDYFGREAQIRVLRRAETFGAPVFVVDFDRGARHFRTLGSFGGFSQVTEQSSMDLLYPERLVFHYERLMSLTFTMGPRAAKALLLGVGGAAMWRFVRAYLPECTPTLVDSDETILAIARRWFYLKQPVVIDTAQRFLAGASAQYDVVLVDLYGPGGPAENDQPFWARCLDTLAPGGCLAANWADFAVNPQVRPMAEALSAAARARGFEPIFVTRRGFHDNLVQYVPTTPEPSPQAMDGALDRLVNERHIPDRGRGILENCIIGTRFPIE